MAICGRILAFQSTTLSPMLVLETLSLIETTQFCNIETIPDRISSNAAGVSAQAAFFFKHLSYSSPEFEGSGKGLKYLFFNKIKFLLVHKRASAKRTEIKNKTFVFPVFLVVYIGSCRFY